MGWAGVSVGCLPCCHGPASLPKECRPVSPHGGKNLTVPAGDKSVWPLSWRFRALPSLAPEFLLS